MIKANYSRDAVDADAELTHWVSFRSAATPHALENVLSELYPSGPSEMEIWSRAGGELSLLKQGQPGRAAWHAAVKILSQGGGGKDISRRSLIRMALEDFPQNLDLAIYEV
ncbi:effector-associated domain EAD1-containing protein [Pseudomonas sp. SG20052]|uniref:effector-associated domain EAD1-containing protein n=1 Tax=Pseudomonas sp. SG20052 TaxID=3074147 RepID=UPI00287FD329|nr:effector-associated domain EAD1-containing protein [Pseudomonas sp. SG20052]WNF55721.1 effector-associated domain EAD1-containing protein [Pseudomonas sp. SG20052]